MLHHPARQVITVGRAHTVASSAGKLLQSQQKALNNHNNYQRHPPLFVLQNEGPDDQSLLLGPRLFPPECFSQVGIRTILVPSDCPARLDTASLKRCRSVSEEWRHFIDLRVWGCPRYKPNIIRLANIIIIIIITILFMLF